MFGARGCKPSLRAESWLETSAKAAFPLRRVSFAAPPHIQNAPFRLPSRFSGCLCSTLCGDPRCSSWLQDSGNRRLSTTTDVLHINVLRWSGRRTRRRCGHLNCWCPPGPPPALMQPKTPAWGSGSRFLQSHLLGLDGCLQFLQNRHRSAGPEEFSVFRHRTTCVNLLLAALPAIALHPPRQGPRPAPRENRSTTAALLAAAWWNHKDGKCPRCTTLYNVTPCGGSEEPGSG